MARNIGKRILAVLRAQFIAGLLILVPLVLSAIIIVFLFRTLDDILAPVLLRYMGEYYVKGLGVLLLLFIIWFIGLITRNVFGKQIVGLYETILSKIPIINTVFGSIKQISDNLLSGKSKSFKQVVLVNFPFYGVYAIGFLTSSEAAKLKTKSKPETVVHVFMPTTPNPTSGFLTLIPVKNITPLSMPVEEGLKVVISMGVVHPGSYHAKKLSRLKQKKLKKTAGKNKRK